MGFLWGGGVNIGGVKIPQISVRVTVARLEKKVAVSIPNRDFKIHDSLRVESGRNGVAFHRVVDIQLKGEHSVVVARHLEIAQLEGAAKNPSSLDMGAIEEMELLSEKKARRLSSLARPIGIVRIRPGKSDASKTSVSFSFRKKFLERFGSPSLLPAEGEPVRKRMFLGRPGGDPEVLFLCFLFGFGIGFGGKRLEVGDELLGFLLEGLAESCSEGEFACCERVGKDAWMHDAVVGTDEHVVRSLARRSFDSLTVIARRIANPGGWFEGVIEIPTRFGIALLVRENGSRLDAHVAVLATRSLTSSW